MKAAAALQGRLLVVQGHDTALRQLDHKLQTMPAKAELASSQVAVVEAAEAVAGAKVRVSDIQRELTAVEDEVTKVEQRRRRDTDRLESGGGTSREIQALVAEVEALERRRDVLEEAQLEVMERLEEAGIALGQLEQALAQNQAKVAELIEVVAAESAQIEAEQAEQRTARDQAALGLGEDLMALYERLRERQNGVGAAALIQRRCDGCRLEVTPAHLAEIRAAAEDDVVRCEECGRILVRGEDSGQ
ncbi:MAG: C4-type zinc ribbon domain-containing protein [Micrococcales bacterium]|nr:C4-type zinc ribbon domain-containing protein [Micrococcales bacterium]